MKEQGIAGVYSALTALIKQKEDEERLAISADQLVEEVQKEIDVYSVPIGWYVKFALKQAAEVALNQSGYRSVVKGNGLFVNPNDCDKKEYLKKLFNNAKLTERQKQQVVEMLKKRIAEVDIPGQYSFDMNGNIAEDITTSQLIDMLKIDAGIA